MTTGCAIKGCGNNGTISSDSDGITFHRFPNISEIKEMWIRATGRVNFLPAKSDVVCSRHFSPDCYYRRRLYESAVPTLHLPGLDCELKSEELTNKEYNLNERRTFDVVRLYEIYPCLWDNKSPAYKSTDARDCALQNIVFQINDPAFGAQELKAMLHKIHIQYAIELSRIQRSIIEGASAYSSPIIWFSAADRFLKNIVPPCDRLEPCSLNKDAMPSASTNLMQDSVKLKIEQDEGMVEEYVSLETDLESELEQPPDISAIPISNISDNMKDGHEDDGKNKTDNSELLRLSSAVERLEKAVKTEMDAGNVASNEFETFGRSLATQLQKMPTEDALKLQMEIQELISRKRINLLQNT